MNEQNFIDVTVIEPRLKHPSIFNAFDGINSGEAIVIHNDHDPKPLYYQLLGERGNCFSWTYLANGPEIWEVEIRKNDDKAGQETLGEIAAKDMRKADVFKKMGLDFCCGGKKTLEEACLEKGLDVMRVKDELKFAETKARGQYDFTSWKPSFLADYIVNVHHSYVNENGPVLKDLADKVASHHGRSMPYLQEVNKKVRELVCELTTHLKKEEQVLFPYIKSLEANAKEDKGFSTVQDPIWVMERDHEVAGEIMRDLRELTTDFTKPAGACNSVGLLMHKLNEFESDLHIHIHLENNILFPKALEMER